MLTHTALFVDICTHLTRWCGDPPQIPESDIQASFQVLPKAAHYAIEIAGQAPQVQLMAYDDPDYPMGTRLMFDAFRDPSRRLKDADATARQIYTLVSQTPAGREQMAHTLYLHSLLAELLIRHASESLAIRIDLHTCRTGFRLGLIGTGRLGNVLVNECFDYTTNNIDVPEGIETQFARYHRDTQGDQYRLYYRDVRSLDAITHQGGRVAYFPGCWPVLGFTALSGDGGSDCPGLALKTPEGWVVIIRESLVDDYPYHCHHIPCVYQKQFGIRPATAIGEESVELLLSALQLHHACRF